MGFSIETKSGGLVEVDTMNSGMYGRRLWLHVDQTLNVNNGEGDASIVLTNQEVKDLISSLNQYIEFDEGKPFVVLAEPLIHPDVTIVIDGEEVDKSKGIPLDENKSE